MGGGIRTYNFLQIFIAQQGNNFPPKTYVILDPQPREEWKPGEHRAQRNQWLPGERKPGKAEEYPGQTRVTRVLSGNPSIRIFGDVT